MPLLLPGEDSAVRQKLTSWLDRQRLRPKIVGEFDDNALMTAFGQAGVGAFAVPTVIEDEYLATGDQQVLGRAADIRSEYYAISVERKLTHPCVLAITASARSRFVPGQTG
jgi:LysR family transcriptional activator of nhaA